MKTPKTAYEKDILHISKFLAGRSNGLHLDTADLVRGERLFMQLASPTKKNPQGRPFYITFNGKGVFRRQFGQDDIPVIRGVNTNLLDKLIEKLDPPELSQQEMDAVDSWLGAQANYEAAQAVGGDAPPPKINEDFPEPINIIYGETKESVFQPFDVPNDNLQQARGEFLKQLEEFLIRFRYLIIGSDPTKDPMIHPKFLDENGMLNVKKFPDVAEWLSLRAIVGTQFGIQKEEAPPPLNKKPLDQCLSMLVYAPKKSNIILMLEGFKEEFNSDKGEIFMDSIREFEYALRKLENTTNQLVVVASAIDWGASAIAKLMTIYSLNSPDFADIQEILRGILAAVFRTNKEFYFTILKNITKENEPTGEAFDKALIKIVNSLRGLSEFQIADVVWTSLRSWQDLDATTLDSVRKDIINRTPGLTIYEPNVTFDDIGGMEQLRDWVEEKGDKLFLTEEEAKEEFGGHTYKGILLVGLPGTGKSLVTKAIANYLSKNTSGYSVSLVQLDVGALMGQYVGQTEQRTREALKTLEAFAPVVCWLDEIDKSFGGTGLGGHEVSRRMLGTFLTFMQERKSPVFLVATANNIDNLPPEFKRKGRWDAVFYMPLPDKQSSISILDYHLSRFKLAKGKMASIKKIISNTTDGEKKFLMWRRLAYSGNTKGEPELITGPGGKAVHEVDPNSGQPADVLRYCGFTGAEIEASVKTAIAKVQAQFKKMQKSTTKIPGFTMSSKSWQDMLTVDDLILALKTFKPVSQQETEGTPDKPGTSMKYIMYRLEQAADKIPSANEISRQREKLLNELSELKIEEGELEDISKILGDIKDIDSKRNPSRKIFNNNFYLLGREFYNRWYS